MTIAILCSLLAPAQAQNKTVFAHYMLTNQDYQADDPGSTPPGKLKVQAYEREIVQAQQAGIDGFALNCGGWSTQTYYITYATEMFQAAVALNSGFKLMFSADFAPGINQEHDALDMMRRFGNDPTYSAVYFKYNNKFVLSSFSGDQTGYGTTFWQALRTDLTTGSNPSGAINGFAAPSNAPMSVLFLPCFFLGGTNPALSEVAVGWTPWTNIVDGLFYWGVVGVAGSGLPQNDQIPPMNYTSQITHASGKLFMAPVTFQFWSPNNPNGNQYYEAQGYHQMRTMWNNIINTSHADLVEEPTWNDFIEGSYISPIDDPNKYPNANFLGTTGVPTSQLGYYHSHIGAWAMTPYFANWYKTGVQPTITQDLVCWAYRTQSKNFVGGGGPQTGTLNGPVTDSIYVSVNAAAPATLKVTVGGTVTTINVPQGSNDFSVPFTTGVTPAFELDRGGSAVIAQTNATDQIQTSPQFNDWYYSTGYAQGPVLSQAPTAPTNVTIAGGNNQAKLTWSPSTGTANITYFVYRGTTAGGESTTAISPGITAGWYAPTLSYTDTSAVNGTHYFYTVKGVNSLGTSGASSEVNTTPAAFVAASAPTTVTASGFDNQITLGWNASSSGSGPITYNVYRGTSAGLENATPIAQNVGATGYVDAGLNDSTTYFYKIGAVNAAGTTMSTETQASTSTPMVRIACGSPTAVGSYSADKDFQTGVNNFTVAMPVDISQAVAPAPAAVYTTGHWGAMTCTVPGLTSGQTYIVRLHFCESSWFLNGSRVFNVSINGTTFLPNFDIFATGGQLVPVIENIPVTANSSGQIVIAFAVGSKDNPEINGVEVLSGGTIPTAPAVPAAAASANNGQVLLSWPSVPKATSYNVYRGTTPGGEDTVNPVAVVTAASLTDSFLANGTTYYYKVAAVNNAGTSALSSEVNATPAATASAPTTPTNLVPTAGNASVTLNWGASTGTGTITYNIFRGLASGSETLLTTASSATFTDTSVTNGTKYFYYVTASNTVGTSGNSNEVNATPAAPTLGTVPTGLAATPGVGNVALTWNTSTGTPTITYNLYRSTTSGTEALVQTGLSSTAFTDSGLASGTTYFYKVASVNPAGTSALSGEVSAKTLTAVYQINTGGPAVAPFVADEFFDSGTQFAAANTIDTSGASSPAPTAVYQSVRWNPTMNYTIPGLTAGSTYLVRLHFIELSFAAAGSRKFNVAINGTNVLSAFDVFAAAGGQNKALVKEFNATANASGQVVIGFTTGGADNPDIAGIEIYGNSGGGGTPPVAPASLSATGANAQVSLTWPASSGATSYNILRSTSTGTETQLTTSATNSFTNTGLTNGTQYFYKVNAVNSFGTSGNSPEATATPQPSLPGTTTLSGTAANSSVNLSWTASSGATSYNIYQNGTLKTNTGNTNLSATVSGLTNGTSYTFTVAGVNSAGTGTQSNSVPLTPNVSLPGTTTLSGTAGDTLANLSWTASSGATSYNIYQNGTLKTNTGNTNLAGTVSGLTNGTTYNFTVAGVNAAGTGSQSNSIALTPTPASSMIIGIACGNSAVAPYVADVDFSGGAVSSGTTTAISTTGITNPAPQSVYQHARKGTCTYTIPGLTAGTSYTVRLHFAEYAHTGTGQRQFNVSINGTQVLTNFDIFAAAGGEFKANVQQFTATANGSGQIVLVFTTVLDNVLINGIEIDGTGGGGTPPPTPTGLTVTLGNAQATLNWNASTGATSYNVYRSTTSGGEGTTPITTGVTGTTFINTGLTNGTTYFYKVAAVNSFGTSAQSVEISATPAGPPATPTGLTATPSSTQIVLNWGAVPGATSYNILRSTSTGTETQLTTSATNSFTNTGLTNGTPYFYKVSAVNASGTSGLSSEVTATPTGGVAGIDLIVTSISWTPTTLASGTHVVFSCVVKNQGSNPTPAGTIVGCQFAIDGVTSPITWSDTNTTSLGAGQSVTLTANSGTGGNNFWTAVSGSHTVQAWVDDVNRIAESNETNNKTTAPISVP